MKTPKEYTDLIKKKKLTVDIIARCIYSVNKRAKNNRDKIKEYKSRPYYIEDRYLESNKEKMEEYYQYKEELLSAFSPTVIHRQFIGIEKIRVYSYQENYKQVMEEEADNIVYENQYYDREEEVEVCFFDYETGKKKYLYFYYYKLGDFGFHTPISEEKAKADTNLEIISIDDNFATCGQPVGDLLSVQFVRKVIALIESKDYEIID